jgi:nitrite reductase/ring-hydroxylating ferredoxin subunit
MPESPEHPIDESRRADEAVRHARWRLTSTAAMIAGLVGGYGLLGWVATRFMLPARIGRMQQFFVASVSDFLAGSTVLYNTPNGHTVNITRHGSAGTADDFIALSSTCPHLGCQVRWEGQNNRYFCPCHNGTFDPTGKATGGPPGEAGQSLPRYALAVERGLLYINVPAEQLSVPREGGIVRRISPEGPGHDPCLACFERRARTGRRGNA